MPLDRGAVTPLGQLLRRKRERLRLSLEDMVELFKTRNRKLDKGQISRIETGKTTMPPWFFGAYMEILQVIVAEDAQEVGLKIQLPEGVADLKTATKETE